MTFDGNNLEKYSSAITLSDMEIFVFPELLYSLVLANIMSPIVWSWREDRWFRKITDKTPYRRILRLKQFIVDHFEFNLDLDTWGLTSQERELARFAPFMDEETIGRSNALFGYEGDKYYFDIDIRRHFGLDKYTAAIIPYWKTETVEAMSAFRYREGYREGAGECVSLSTLYAAALFVVCEIPLDDIFLMATPLHSQNFIAVDDGVLTNNRRVVTKNMWYNGSELSARAQRALRNEQVTMVAHHTGYIHVVYPEATIAPDAYQRFRGDLSAYLKTSIDMDVLMSFLRYHSELQKCFQVEQEHHGRKRYLPAEKAYAYEHNSRYRMDLRTWEQLIDEIDEYAFEPDPIEDRMLLHVLCDFFDGRKVDFDDPESIRELKEHLRCPKRDEMGFWPKLEAFCRTVPRLPGEDKSFTPKSGLDIRPGMSREEIVDYIESARGTNPVADLAFYAFRDLSRTDWAPFIQAALERNPVCIEQARGLSDAEVIARLEHLPNESIYDGARMAQPDEVWNYGRGDGAERALTLAVIMKARDPNSTYQLRVAPDAAALSGPGAHVRWPSAKGLKQEMTL